MQYVMYIRLAIMVLTFISQIRTAREQGTDADLSGFTALLAQIGESFGIKELKSAELTALAPELIKLVGLVKNLREIKVDG
jgi:hypothetical protein